MQQWQRVQPPLPFPDNPYTNNVYANHITPIHTKCPPKYLSEKHTQKIDGETISSPKKNHPKNATSNIAEP